MEVNVVWWRLRTSNPSKGGNVLGEFDSHTPPPFFYVIAGYEFGIIKREYRLVSGNIRKILFLPILMFLFFQSQHSLFSQSGPFASTGRWGDYLTMRVALIGPGDELYFWWGHIGLVVEDSRTNRVRFYDWGIFSFDTENFFTNFAFGRLIYSTGVSWAEANYDVYINTNRCIILYTLDLPAEKKEAIFVFAERSILPENRDYYYHHFDDNCATRIRDVIDMALGGQLKAEFGDMPARFTLRQHVRRHTWFSPFFDWILNFWMGQNIDKPITVWDEMFLPSEFVKRIVDFRYIDSDGRERALVSSVEVINQAINRPAVRDFPINPWPGALLVSLLFCEVILLFYLLRGKRKDFRVFLGTVNSLLGFLLGIAGSLLFFMMLFTEHDYTFDNINIIFANPLFLAVVPLGLIFGFTKNIKKRIFAVRLLKVLWVYVFWGCFFTIVIRFFPAFIQQNQVTQALVIPIALTMVFVLSRLSSFNSKF